MTLAEANSVRVGWLTCRDHAQLIEDDRRLLPLCQQAEIDVVPIVWTEPIDWPLIDTLHGVVIRTPWDYQHQLPDFLDCLQQLEHRLSSNGRQLYNPLAVVRWNSHKGYLQELQDRWDISVVPTALIESFSLDALSSLTVTGVPWALCPNEYWVLKPAVGASGLNNFKVPAPQNPLLSDEWPQVLAAVEGITMMVQPFLTNITQDGETALFYFNGHYSHAVMKRPKAGDYRVQEHFGGSASPYEPTPEEHALGQQVLTALEAKFNLNDPLLYVRVDMIVDSTGVSATPGQPMVMEVELIEPKLFFQNTQAGRQHFVDALRHRLVETKVPTSP